MVAFAHLERASVRSDIRDAFQIRADLSADEEAAALSEPLFAAATNDQPAAPPQAPPERSTPLPPSLGRSLSAHLAGGSAVASPEDTADLCLSYCQPQAHTFSRDRFQGLDRHTL